MHLNGLAEVVKLQAAIAQKVYVGFKGLNTEVSVHFDSCHAYKGVGTNRTPCAKKSFPIIKSLKWPPECTMKSAYALCRKMHVKCMFEDTLVRKHWLRLIQMQKIENGHFVYLAIPHSNGAALGWWRMDEVKIAMDKHMLWVCCACD